METDTSLFYGHRLSVGFFSIGVLRVSSEKRTSGRESYANRKRRDFPSIGKP